MPEKRKVCRSTTSSKAESERFLMMPTGAIELGKPVDLFFWADDIALHEIAITTTIVRRNMLVIFQTIKVLIS